MTTNSETSIKTMWAAARNKWGLLGPHGILVLIFVYPFTDAILPHLNFDRRLIGSSLFSGSLTLLGFIAAGIAVVIGSGSERLIAVMYQGRHLHAFMLHFLWVAGSWTLTVFASLALMMLPDNTWLTGSTISLFAYSLLSTMDILVSLIRFGILSAQEAALTDPVVRPMPHPKNVDAPKR